MNSGGRISGIIGVLAKKVGIAIENNRGFIRNGEIGVGARIDRWEKGEDNQQKSNKSTSLEQCQSRGKRSKLLPKRGSSWKRRKSTHTSREMKGTKQIHKIGI